MKYEFHVGDYVETKDGYTGYVKSFRTYYDYNVNDDAVDLVCIEERDGKNRKDRLWVTSDVIPRHFNRIGQYNFTKPEHPKDIKKLKGRYGNDFTLYEGEEGAVSVLSSKINELVDAVNKLRKDYDKHLEFHRQTER